MRRTRSINPFLRSLCLSVSEINGEFNCTLWRPQRVEEWDFLEMPTLVGGSSSFISSSLRAVIAATSMEFVCGDQRITAFPHQGSKEYAEFNQGFCANQRTRNMLA